MAPLSYNNSASWESWPTDSKELHITERQGRKLHQRLHNTHTGTHKILAEI